jgi:hypothetical protein
MEYTRLSVCFFPETAERSTIKLYIGFETLVVQREVTTKIPCVKSESTSINVLKYYPSYRTLLQVIK